jgi:hypothetical protein
MPRRSLEGIRNAVARSFAALGESEYDFLAERRDAILAIRPALEAQLAIVERRLSTDFRFNPWLPFRTSEGVGAWPAQSRHRLVPLDRDAAIPSALSIAFVQGSFDPFHLGHLAMGLDAVSAGACQFACYVPNADAARGGPGGKPNKSAFPWRLRTALAGGVDDFWPLTRASTFGIDGNVIESYAAFARENADVIDALDRVEFVAVIGSDVVFRPNFVAWTNAVYGQVPRLRGDGKLGLSFRVVARTGYEADSGGRTVADIVRALDFPAVIVPELSCASSSSVRRGDEGAAWLYPRSIPLLEAFLLYGGQL